MERIKSYKQFRSEDQVNEEFIGALIKGALGKLGSLFAAPFKDMAKDFKDMFKEDDPNSIKSIIMNNLNQAIDGSQKEIPNLKDDASVLGVMDSFVSSLVQLANGIGKDIESALGKGKSNAVIGISKAILLGNKGIDFVGIVGLLDPEKGLLKKNVNFKYSKSNYVAEVNKGKDIKAKQQIASKFLDNLQKEVQKSLDVNFTKEELDELYDQIGKESGQGDGMTYDKLKELFDNKTPVMYLLKGKTKEEFEKLTDDQKKKPNEAPVNTIVGVKPIVNLNDQNKPDSVVFNDKDGEPTIKKSYTEILGPAEGSEEQRSEEAKQAAEALGKIKQDPDKMKKVANFAQFLQNDANKDKIAEIEKILGGGQQPAGEA
jgi:hypothetical protein